MNRRIEQPVYTRRQLEARLYAAAHASGSITSPVPAAERPPYLRPRQERPAE